MRVLVTGGGGFIGSHVVERLLARGDEALVIDNYATGRRDNLSPCEGLVVVEETIADADAVDRQFDAFRPDVVVHAAASYKDPSNWAEDVATNVLGTANVVRAAERGGVRRLIYFQTALCYGLRPAVQPIPVDHPLQPEGSSYALSKAGGEQYVRLSGLDFIVLRLANAYGPRNLSGPLPTFYQRLTTGRPCHVVDSRRDFIFIDDLVDVVMQALEGTGARGAYNVSSGSDYAIKELFDEVVAALGIEPPPVKVQPRKPDDAPTILLDPSKTEEVFGWRASTPLHEGVGRAVRYYRAHGVTETYTHLKLEMSTAAAPVGR